MTKQSDKNQNEAEAPVVADDDVRAETIALASETLRGDMRDTILGWFKAMQKPWAQMSEAEQLGFAGTINSSCHVMIDTACNIIAANGRKCIVARLEQYAEKDGLKITLKATGHSETVAALHEACGREVLLIASAAEEHKGGSPIETTPDQKPLFDNTSMGQAAE